MTLSRQLFAQFRLEIFSWAQIELTPNNPSEVRLSFSFILAKDLEFIQRDLKTVENHIQTVSDKF